MKKILSLIIFLILTGIAYSQPIVNRSGQANTVQDARWAALYNLFTPRYADTTAANGQKGIDTSGAIIFNYSTNTLWYRQSTPKKWVELSAGSSFAGWALTGNVGTTAGTNFLGTTDNVDLVFKRNSVQAGRLGTNNISYGINALVSLTSGTSNTAIGNGALFSNTSGLRNTAIGSATLQDNTTGDDNMAMGSNTLVANASGSRNTGIGSTALTANTTGDDNTAIGYNSLVGNVGASKNTVVGSFMLTGTTTGGDANVGIGYLSGNSNTTGSGNVVIGNEVFKTNTTGYNNIAIGAGNTMDNNTTGHDNIAIGESADVASSSGIHAIAIGQLARAENESVAIGTNAVSETNQFAISDSFQTIKARGLDEQADTLTQDLLSFDRSTGLIKHINIGLIGGGGTTGLQDAITEDNMLTQNNTIDATGFDLKIKGVEEFATQTAAGVDIWSVDDNGNMYVDFPNGVRAFDFINYTASEVDFYVRNPATDNIAWSLETDSTDDNVINRVQAPINGNTIFEINSTRSTNSFLLFKTKNDDNMTQILSSDSTLTHQGSIVLPNMAAYASGGYDIAVWNQGSNKLEKVAALDSSKVTGLHTEGYYNTKYLTAIPSNQKTMSFGINIDGGGGVPTASTTYGYFVVPYDGTITGWQIAEYSSTPVSSSAVVDVVKTSYGSYPTASSIAGSELPTLSSATINRDLSLSTWTTSVTSGDIIRFTLNSVTSALKLNITIFLTKS